MPFASSWHGENGTQSELSVRPHTTTDGNAPMRRSKKARILNMSVSHRFGTDYPLSAVMLGWRGDDSGNREQVGEMVQQTYNRPETMKKKDYGPTAQAWGAIGASKGGENQGLYF